MRYGSRYCQEGKIGESAKHTEPKKVFVVRGLVKFFPAVTYLLYLNLPAAFSQPRANTFFRLCIRTRGREKSEKAFSRSKVGDTINSGFYYDWREGGGAVAGRGERPYATTVHGPRQSKDGGGRDA